MQQRKTFNPLSISLLHTFEISFVYRKHNKRETRLATKSHVLQCDIYRVTLLLHLMPSWNELWIWATYSYMNDRNDTIEMWYIQLLGLFGNRIEHTHTQHTRIIVFAERHNVARITAKFCFNSRQHNERRAQAHCMLYMCVTESWLRVFYNFFFLFSRDFVVERIHAKYLVGVLVSSRKHTYRL